MNRPLPRPLPQGEGGSQTALFLSPHLDDVAFSAGGTAARLAAAGWRVVIATAFTRSVANPAGFALACQTDKGFAPDVDYMALRRAEDFDACALLGAEVLHGDLPEAPHRGYAAETLFGATLPGDGVLGPLCALLEGWVADVAPDIVFGPQGLGNHVDHQWMVKALLRMVPADRRAWYRDTPYAIRSPASAPNPGVMGRDEAVAIGDVVGAKVAACRAYGSQLGFQFGGAGAVGPALEAFAAAEARAAGASADVLAERFLFTSSALDVFLLR